MLRINPTAHTAQCEGVRRRHAALLLTARRLYRGQFPPHVIVLSESRLSTCSHTEVPVCQPPNATSARAAPGVARALVRCGQRRVDPERRRAGVDVHVCAMKGYGWNVRPVVLMSDIVTDETCSPRGNATLLLTAVGASVSTSPWKRAPRKPLL